MCPNLEKLLTADDIVAMTGFKLKSIQKMARQGRIPAYRVGNEWRFNRDEIRIWLERRRQCMVVMSPATAARVTDEDVPVGARLYRPGDVMQDNPLTVGVLLASRDEVDRFVLHFPGLIISGLEVATK